MECYNHPGKISPALCRVCSKGLCRDCLQEYGGMGFVCSDTCGERAAQHEQIMEWNQKNVIKKGKSSGLSRQYGYVAIIFAVIGLTFIGQGIYDHLYNNRKIFVLPIIFGGCMLLLASVFKRLLK